MRTFAAVLLLIGSPCSAQDVFSTNGSRSSCDAARAAEDGRYSQTLKAIQAKYEASTPRPGPPDLARLRQYANERGNEDTRHAKAMVDLDAGVCSVLRQTGSSPCDRATYLEDKLYERNMADLEKRRLDEDNQANRQRMNCGSEAGCVAAVNKNALTRLQAWSLAREQEMERHTQALGRIRAGDCGIHQSGSDPCYTPARAESCPPVRFGWGDCPGTRQTCDWCYGPNGVFAYQPRGS